MAGGATRRVGATMGMADETDLARRLLSTDEYTKISGGGVPQAARMAKTEEPTGFARLLERLREPTPRPDVLAWRGRHTPGTIPDESRDLLELFGRIAGMTP
mgnify:CR=1 FL=1